MCPWPDRRRFLQATVCGAALAATSPPVLADKNRDFRISLTQWSLQRALTAGKLDPLDFARAAQRQFGLEAVEYVSRFFPEPAVPERYLAEMNKRAADHGVRQLLVFVQDQGPLGHPDAKQRQQTVLRYVRWVDVARALGCHSIAVNPAPAGTKQGQPARIVESLRTLLEYATPLNINVLLGNFGGLATDIQWLTELVETFDSPRCGTAPHLGHFPAQDQQEVAPLAQLAKAVTAGMRDFDEQGNETLVDYSRMLDSVLQAGYRGYVGIDYQGELEEPAGIRASKALLQRIRNGKRADQAKDREKNGPDPLIQQRTR